MRHVITEGEQVVSEILVGPGLIDDSPLLPERDGRSRVAILNQPAVKGLAQAVAESFAAEGLATVPMTLPDGEAAKQMTVIEDVYRRLATAGVARGDSIVAIGGGALTDAAGFVAATYMRGIEAVFIPTTLLGAVDAAVGGKSAVNVDGKNLAGVFRHPVRVIVDLELLAELPESLLAEGGAEALKTGYIGDPDLVALYETHGLGAPLDEVVNRAVAVKAEVVSSDFTERGRRAILNYGHTIGHAVEVAAGMSHGHAVAVGMVAAATLSEMMTGFDGAGEQRDLIASLGLAVDAPTVSMARAEELMALDKKRDDGGMRFVVLEAVGRPAVVHADPASVRAALAAVGIEEHGA
ncbi:MAG: 3-dehydroquinate synthase [Acidimicrobiia bacterium]|nr:MAG: 3-dehydroquinate synthase [Acidimicrobiia bacterium]